MNLNKGHIVLIILLFLLANGFQKEETGELEVIVEGLRNDDGQLMISLSRGPIDFPDGNYYRQLFIPEYTAPRFTVVLKDVPYGNYAVSLLHDEDTSGEMNKNFFGMPKEGFAFSRNFKVVLRAPKYDEVNFEFKSPRKSTIIIMQYR